MSIRKILSAHYAARDWCAPNPRRMELMVTQLNKRKVAPQRLAYAINVYEQRQSEMDAEARKLIALFLAWESGRGVERKRKGRGQKPESVLELAEAA